MSDVIREMLARLAQQDSELLRLYPPGFGSWPNLSIGVDPGYDPCPPYELHKLYVDRLENIKWEPTNYPVQGFISEMYTEVTMKRIDELRRELLAIDYALLKPRP